MSTRVANSITPGVIGNRINSSRNKDRFWSPRTEDERERTFMSAIFSSKWELPFWEEWESGLTESAGNCYCRYIKAHPPAVAPVDECLMLASVQSATDRIPSRATLS